jgi:(2Fe-2S) ferredoxin
MEDSKFFAQDHKTILVCQSRTCRKYGSREVLKAFLTDPVSNTEIIASGCLGQCGNGPMVLILPEKTWYWHISPQDVPLIKQQHLQHNCIVTQLLDPKLGKYSQNR